jgi:hypothetical protein
MVACDSRACLLATCITREARDAGVGDRKESLGTGEEVARTFAACSSARLQDAARTSDQIVAIRAFIIIACGIAAGFVRELPQPLDAVFFH